MLNSIALARRFMKMGEVLPVFDMNNIGERREVFNHDAFIKGDAEQRREIMRKSSESKEKDETAFSFDNYFGFQLRPYLQGKDVLDLGCFTGGRTVAWFKNYGFQHAAGIDVEQVFIDAADQYALLSGVNCEFKLGFGENIPYSSNIFDAVLTFDVLEHVVDVERTMEECWRVLKPGGSMFLVFPTYLQPNEHHLGMVSKVPGLQLMFSGSALVRAYYEIIDERGAAAYWYRRDSPELSSHEKGHTINGMSFAKFSRIVKKMGWKDTYTSRAPVGSIGRSVMRHRVRRAVMQLALPMTFVPFLQEIVLHRVTKVLVKPLA